MKTEIAKLTSGRALMALAALTVALSSASAQTPDKTRGPASTIQGVWQTMVTPVDCTTGNPLVPPFLQILAASTEAAPCSEYGISPGMTPALRSPGHGIWQHDGGPNFWFTYCTSTAMTRTACSSGRRESPRPWC